MPLNAANICRQPNVMPGCGTSRGRRTAIMHQEVFRIMGKLNAAAEKKIREICGRYKEENTPLMMILSDIQNEYGYIPLEVQEVVSEETGISVAEIY